MKTKEERLELYRKMLQKMYDNPTWGIPGKYGLCTIASLLGLNFVSDYYKDSMSEIYKRRTKQGCYWFNNRGERIQALKEAIEELSEIKN